MRRREFAPVREHREPAPPSHRPSAETVPARDPLVPGTTDELIQLQATAGNEAVTGLVAQRAGGKGKGKAKKKAPPVDARVEHVKTAVKDGRFADGEQQLAAGEYGPARPGGAFWMLNGLSPDDLYKVSTGVGKDVRAKLIEHIAEADGKYNRARLESGIRAAMEAEKTAGSGTVSLIDALTVAGDGSFAPVWALLTGKSRPALIGVLRLLPRDLLVKLQGKLSEAPAADSAKLTDAIGDLVGTGTDMKSTDVIDLEGLKGLDRQMAGIYNQRGHLIAEQATALTIPSHAAAGIMKVESGGATFNAATDKTIIRFENHVFWKYWGKANKDSFNAHFDFERTAGGKPFHGHKWRESATGEWSDFHGDQEAEWRVIAFAASLGGQENAYKSASWGAGQVMGFNHSTVGFNTAVEMAAQYNKSERSQITGIFEYIRENNLAQAVRDADYATVAAGYNGSGQKATYAALIKAAADAYQKVTKGKTHVVN
ncbi:hypothetical protein Afil01_61040 [Actinorhabdospora filicis]|uniref:N-acetylmuramidase domain-containing protein n=2 Tax=Actinorhabdospora filicis TaxID=1785913 RepID=A0A9W6SS70_9ACTN|nr:hypothetical protein Afil01_61040 [Actinorhabdospora filicis]